jgi:hypothetical protein
MVVNTALVGGAVACGACVAGLTKPEDLVKQAEAVGERAKVHASAALGRLGGALRFDRDGGARAPHSPSRALTHAPARRHACVRAIGPADTARARASPRRWRNRSERDEDHALKVCAAARTDDRRTGGWPCRGLPLRLSGAGPLWTRAANARAPRTVVSSPS